MNCKSFEVFLQASAALLILEMCCLTEVRGSNAEKRLFDDLFESYDARVVPTKTRKPVQVAMQYWLLSMEDLDGTNQEMTAYGWIQMEWVDEYLQWNASDYDNIDVIVVASGAIWHPDVIIRNSVIEPHGDILDHKKFQAIVNSTGVITYYTAGKTQTACTLDLEYYPFDSQACYIHVDSWTYPEHRMRLTNISTHLNTRLYRPNGQWNLTDTKVVVEREHFNMAFTKMLFIVYLRRKPFFYFMMLVVPVMLLSFLVLLAFMMPADSGEKISLEITVILSFTVFQLLIADNVPDTSDYVPIMSAYILTVIVLASMSLVCTVVVLKLHHHSRSSRPPPWLRHLTQNFMARILCMKSDVKQQPSTTDSKSTSKSARRRSLRSTFNSLHDHHDKDDPIDSNNELAPLQPANNNQRGAKPNTSDYMHQGMAALIELGESIVEQMSDDDENDAVHSEWSSIAKVFDRFFSVVFFIATFSMTVGLLVVYPHLEAPRVEPERIT